MQLFRACNRRYADRLDGEGARKVGGRWNSRGVPMIYTATSRSLAILESLVHFSDIRLVPDSYVMLTLDMLNTASVQEITTVDLPADFHAYNSHSLTRKLGNEWIESMASLGLKVPSAIVREEYNLLLNPNHPEIQKVKLHSITSFGDFDPRLF